MEGLNLGFSLAACILVGFWIGCFLDSKLGLQTPWFTMILTLVGLGAGIREAVAVGDRLNRKSERDQRRDERSDR